MVRKTLKAKDTYEIMASTIFNDFDRKILTRLYQPIVGFEAVSLYFNLWVELEGEQSITTLEKNHNRLVELMQCEIKILERSFKRLEAVGLLQTYFLENEGQNRYVYFLKSPKTPKGFYETDILDAFLRQNVDSLEYERTKQYFTNYHYIDPLFKNVSTSFSDMFSLSGLNASLNGGFEDIKDSTVSEIVFNYDFDELQEKLKDHQVSLKKLTDEEKNIIANLAVAYDISFVDMRIIVLNSLKRNSTKIDFDKLKINARRFSSAPKIKVEPRKETEIIQTGNKALDNHLEQYGKMTPQEFLRVLHNNQDPMDVDLYLVTELQNTTALSNAVINVIIDYTSQKNNHRIPKSYVQKLAGSLIRANITKDPYQAMLYLNQDVRITKVSEQSKSPTKTTSTSKKETKEVTSEDVKKMLEEIQGIKMDEVK